MDARELRIGNFVKDDLGSIGILEQFTPRSYVLKKEFSTSTWSTRSSKTELNLFPIPLTEEWLIKFGFDKTEPTNDDEDIMWKKDIFTIFQDGIDFAYPITMRHGNPREYKIGRELYDVHDLQNLYYAVIKSELTLNQ